MARGIGVFRAERRPKGVHLAERHRHRLGLQLAGHGEAGHLAEKVLAEIHSAILGKRGVLGVQRGDAEHLARALAIAAGDQRRMSVDKPALIKELVDGVSCHRTDAEHRCERVGAGPQMGDRPQIFQTVPLFLQRIGRIRRALQLDFIRVDFQWLFGIGGEHHLSGDDNRSAHIIFGDFLEVVDFGILKNHLKILKIRAVVKLDEAELLGIAQRAHPTADGHLAVRQLRRVLKQRFYLCSLHCVCPPFENSHKRPWIRSFFLLYYKRHRDTRALFAYFIQNSVFL